MPEVHGPFDIGGPDEGYLIGARNVEPVNGGGDWICTKPDHWIFAGTGMKRGRPHPRPRRLGVSRRPGRHPGPRDRRRGTVLSMSRPAAARPRQPGALDRDDLSRPQGQLRLQRLDDLLGAGPRHAARPHAPLVALVPPARPRRAREPDHPQPDPACARRRIAHLDPHTTCAGSPQFCCRQPLEPDAANRSVTISQGRMRKRAVSCARSMRGRSQGRPLRSTGSQARGVNGSLISTSLS